MTTASDLVVLSLRDIGVLDSTEIPSSDLMADSITTLNQMLAQWQVTSNYAYAQNNITFNPTGAESYTIGIGGDISVEAPAKIDYAFLRVNNQDYPIDILNTFEEYQLGIGLKNIGTGTYPECLYYNPTYPLGTIYIYPAPSTGVLHFGVSVQLVNFPPEYELAIRYSLSELLSTMLGVALRPDIAATALRARRIIKRNNVRLNEMSSVFGSNYGLSNYGLMLRG